MSESHEKLRTQLLVKHPGTSPKEYQEFVTSLLHHRFSRLLHLYDNIPPSTKDTIDLSTIPAENEITFLIQSGHPLLFLKNILYHLQRNKKVIPPALIPGILTRFAGDIELWPKIYQHHPELISALAGEKEEWNYMALATQSEFSEQLGSTGYYEILEGRTIMMPLLTSSYIRGIFTQASGHHQSRLLDILHLDPSLESRSFILSHVEHSRKPVRLTALKWCILDKEKSVYEPIKNALIHHLSQSEEDIDKKQLRGSWKDLATLSGEQNPDDILIALTDPDDYIQNHPSSFQSEKRSTLLKAAILHHSQQTLYDMARKSPHLLQDPEVAGALNSDTAIKLLKLFSRDSSSSFDQTYIHLMQRAHPFLNEEDSRTIWQKFVSQWKEMPFAIEELPLEVLALRIHPNRIKSIWQHPLLQETAPSLQRIREILRNRLSFLKKCYK